MPVALLRSCAAARDKRAYSSSQSETVFMLGYVCWMSLDVRLLVLFASSVQLLKARRKSI